MTASILVTGAKGQLGTTIQQHWSQSPLSEIYNLLLYDIDELDLTDASQVESLLSQIKPAAIINTAGYTAVDKAESDPEAAFAVNDLAVRNLASWCAANQSRLIHISTDFVFDGAASQAYRPEDTTAPLSVYGASKLAGEQQLLELLPEGGVVIRTSWLYSEYGANFVKTMLRLMQEKEELSVVDDQIGSPTSTHSLTALIFSMLANKSSAGIYHWSDGAKISWYDFALEIQRQALAQGILDRAIPVRAVTTADYPTPAQRPAYSVLDRSSSQNAFDCDESNWTEQLNRVIKALVQD